MSATVLDSRVRPDPVAARRRSPAPALARTEGRRLLLHPIFLGGGLVSVAAFVVSVRDQAPVLHRDDILVGGAMLPLAAATFLVANLAALRSRRHGTDELYASTVTADATRTVGHLLSVAWATGAAVVLAGAALAYLASLGSVGSPNMLELLTGPAIVAACGVLGVCLARWLPSTATGPVALVILAALEVWLTMTLSGGQVVLSRARWLGPWVSISNLGDPPRELVVRPVGWHIAYLAAIAAFSGAVAVVRGGLRVRPGVVAAVAAAVAVTAGVVQTRGPSAEQLRAITDLAEHPERHQVCRTLSTVRYCAYPSYAAWMERWAEAITPVVRRVPAGELPDGLAVQQAFLFSWGGDLPDRTASSLGIDALGNRVQVSETRALNVGAKWPRGPLEAAYELDLALGMAGWVVGLPISQSDVRLTPADVRGILRGHPPQDRAEARKRIRPGAVYGGCGAGGQARGAIALWLAGQATPRTRSALLSATRPELSLPREPDSGWTFQDYAGNLVSEATYFNPGGELAYLVNGSSWGVKHPEGAYAAQLLNRPPDQVASVLAANWTHLTDPGTTTQALVRLFGLHPAPTLRERLIQGGLTPEDVDAVLAAYEPQYEVPCR